MELAGVIEAVGKDVTRFRPGDAVFASTFAVNFGGHAEYKCLPDNGVLALKPANLTFEEAAAAPGAGQTAWRCLQQGAPSTRAEDPDLRRIRRGRHERGAACQPPLRRRGDRGVQRREPGAGAFVGGVPGD